MIATVWLRTSVLDEPGRTSIRELIRIYVPVRSSFLTAGIDNVELGKSARRSAELRSELWKVGVQANAHSDTYHSLFLNSLSDAFNVSEKRTAALENRIPRVAWATLLFIGSTASFLTGLSLSSRSPLLFCILPVVIGSALTLILDLDTPRSGLIQIQQQSIERLEHDIETKPR